jgi:cyclohexanone monooxygenase
MSASQEAQDYDAIIIGAGMSGLYQLYRLRELGMRVRVFEAGTGVGGTWYWNRYPGARFDSESYSYSYSFSRELLEEWNWSEHFAGQPETERYINHVADRFDLRRDIQFRSRVAAAHWQEARRSWDVTLEDGSLHSARFLVTAIGPLSAPTMPRIEGVETFQGQSCHTARWPKEPVRFEGKRVAVIGTGATGVQTIQEVAKTAGHLTVFQRTPNFSLPAGNRPLAQDETDAMKAIYPDHRQAARTSGFGVPVVEPTRSALEVSEEERNAVYEVGWQSGNLVGMLLAFNDLITNKEANDTACEFIRNKIRSIVKDPQTAEDLCPFDHPMGTKRPCLDSGYYETFNRDNVRLINIRRTPIEEITPTGLRTTDEEFTFDAIVFATGFDAMTGSLLKIDIRGKGERSLKEAWAEGPRTYLGLTTVGFPNLFTITGPGSPSVLTNMIPSIEQHVEWIADCLRYVCDYGFTCIEPTLAAQDAWVDHVNEVAGATLYPTCNSWYLGANIPGKPRVFMPYIGFPPYVQKCNDVAAKGYEGFVLI